MKAPSTTCHGVLLLCLLLVASFPSSHGNGPGLPDPTAGSPSTDPSPPDSTSTAPLTTTSPDPTTTTTTTPQTTTTPTPEPTTTTMPSTTTTTTEATTTNTAPMPSTTTTETTTTTTSTTPMPSTTATEKMTSSTAATTTQPTPSTTLSATTITTTPITTTSAESSETTTTSSTTTSTTTTQSAGELSSTTKQQSTTTTTVATTTVPSKTSTAMDSSSTSSASADTSASMSSSVAPGSSTSADMSSSTAASATTPKPKYPTKQLEKPFELSFSIGDSSDDAVSCENSSICTYRTLSQDIRTAFSSIPGYQYAKEKTSAQRRKRDTLVYVLIVFDSNVLSGLSKNSRLSDLMKALNTLNGFTLLAVNMTTANTTIVQQFVEADMCSVPVVCGVGYSCKQDRCHHLCEDYDCGDHGVCNTVVQADGTSSAQCVCLSDDDHTYSGDRCQDEETSKAKVASIVGGVLGTFCAIFLLVIVFLACRLRNGEGGSKRKYQLGGYSNNGYADQEFAMKNVSENP